MIRAFMLCLVAAVAIAGCQTAPNIAYPPVRVVISPSPPNIFASAPQAPLLSELFVCQLNDENVGPIGERGEAQIYTPYIQTAAGALLRNPTDGACLSSGFGLRSNASGGGRMHTGIDLANQNGGFVFAAGNAHVAALEWRNGYGLVLELDHGKGVHTLYAHLAEINPALSVGSWAPAGLAIARMGATGNATGIHLHYELYIDGQPVDPLAYGAQIPGS